jgi:hypothetical protein
MRKDHGVQVGDFDPVGELADQDVVADLKRRLHGARGDLEGLDHEGADEERDEDRDENGLEVFTKTAALDGVACPETAAVLLKMG